MTGLIAQWTFHEAEAEVVKGKLRCHLIRNKISGQSRNYHQKIKSRKFPKNEIYVFNMRHRSIGHGKNDSQFIGYYFQIFPENSNAP